MISTKALMPKTFELFNSNICIVVYLFSLLVEHPSASKESSLFLHSVKVVFVVLRIFQCQLRSCIKILI